ncbi:MAG: IS200/IS605 family transposase [Planctomycetes bacterium]|nr:IS200/IS605 family transposase [Planctomycetota bacterium]
MPQSLAAIYIHLIFSTKNRAPLIRPELEEELHMYHAGILRNLDSPLLCTGGTEDHVHVLFRLGRKIDVAKIVEKVKAGSSKWIKTKGAEYHDFYWQSGYGAFSIGQSGIGGVKKYIANQKEHHRTRTFQEEFREFLNRYEIAFDERYVWD